MNATFKNVSVKGLNKRSLKSDSGRETGRGKEEEIEVAMMEVVGT